MFVTTTAAVVWGSYQKAGRLVGRWRPASPSVSDTFIVAAADASELRPGVIILGRRKTRFWTQGFLGSQSRGCWFSS